MLRPQQCYLTLPSFAPHPPPPGEALLASSGKAGPIPLWARLVQAVFSGALYGYALLLMLVAMSYNGGIFLALVFGYMVGEALFPTAFEAYLTSQTKRDACCDR